MKAFLFGKKRVYLPAVDSTNSYASAMLSREPVEHGTVIHTERQTHGRGQQGATWSSKPLQNLTFSLVLKPDRFPIEKQFYLSVFLSLGVSDYVSQVLSRHAILSTVLIKWPNDILVSDKKICGMLVENSVSGSWIRSSVAGIGMNINEDFSQSGLNAVSMNMLCGHSFNTEECLDELLYHLEKWYVLLDKEKFAELKEAYHSSLWGYHAIQSFVSGDETFKGSIQGVSESGKLVIQTDEGIKEFSNREIRALI